MSVFTTLHIACRHSCTLHTLVFLQGGLPPELRVLHHTPRSLYMIYGSGRSSFWCAATPSSLHSTQCISPQGDSRGWISIQQSVRNPLVCFPQHASTSGVARQWQPTLVLTCCVQQTPDHQQSSMICLSWQNVRVTVLSYEVMFISVFDSDSMYDSFFQKGLFLYAKNQSAKAI